jgi:hypothetical protein
MVRSTWRGVNKKTGAAGADLLGTPLLALRNDDFRLGEIEMGERQAQNLPARRVLAGKKIESSRLLW